MFLAGGLSAPGWAIGKLMPGRILGSLHILFVLGWLATVFVWSRWPGEPILAARRGVRTLQTAAMVVLALGLLMTGAMRLAVHDLTSRRVFGWHRAMIARHELARQAKARGELDMVLPRQPRGPRLFYRFAAQRHWWSNWDLAEDPQSWRNVRYAQFFGLRSVRLEPETSAPPQVPDPPADDRPAPDEIR